MNEHLFQWLIGIGTTISLSLIGAIKILWDYSKKKDSAHAEDRKEWFKKLEEMMQAQNKAIKEVGEAHDRTVRELSDKYEKRQGEINETMLAAFKQAFGKR